MEFLDLETLLAGVFYVCLSLWWLFSIATKYVSSVRANREFSSRVTYPCCGALNKLPVEGAIKLLFGSLIAILSAVKCYSNCDENRKLGEATIFALFAISGLCDILTQKCQRYVFINIDYFILMFAFLIQSIVSACHIELTTPLAVADDCTMYASVAAALAVLLEFRFVDVLWFSILRSYSTFILGTWNFQVSFMLGIENFGNNRSDVTILSPKNVIVPSISALNITHKVTFTEDQTAQNLDYLLLVPMYFAWHCFVAMVILTILWCLVQKCYGRKVCRRFCSMYEEENESHFEHHIHFDYHIIDRLDSDGE